MYIHIKTFAKILVLSITLATIIKTNAATRPSDKALSFKSSSLYGKPTWDNPKQIKAPRTHPKDIKQYILDCFLLSIFLPQTFSFVLLKHKRQKKELPLTKQFLRKLSIQKLLSDTKLSDDRSVSLDIYLCKVIKKTTSLTNHHKKSSS